MILILKHVFLLTLTSSPQALAVFFIITGNTSQTEAFFSLLALGGWELSQWKPSPLEPPQ